MGRDCELLAIIHRVAVSKAAIMIIDEQIKRRKI